MNKLFIAVLCNALLINSGAFCTEVPTEVETAQRSTRLQSLLNGVATLGSAACSAAVGLCIGKKALDVGYVDPTEWNSRFSRANNLLQPYLDAYAQSLPEGIKNSAGAYSYELKRHVIELLPYDHPYFQEFNRASTSYDIQALKSGALWVTSAIFLITATVIAYNYFYPSEDTNDVSEFHIKISKVI